MNHLTKMAGMALLFMGLSLASSAQSDKADVRAEITGATTMADLSAIKVQMLEAGAYFQMKDLEFDDEGQVTRISVSVNFNDGHNGSASVSDFSNGKKLVILRSYSDSSRPFCIGDCE